MLRIMRDHASSWLIKVILFAIVVVFVFWGVGSFRSRKGSRVAEVNGDLITIDEYRQSYNNLIEQYRRQFGDSLNEGLIEMMQLKRQAIDQLVNQRLMLQEAQRLNIKVTDVELANAIKEIPAFRTNGSFDSQRYRTVLNRNQMTPEQFEAGQREQMTMNKLHSLIVGGVKVSDDEARQWYNWNNASVNLEYLFFDPSAHGDITVEDQALSDLSDYFDKNKDKYKTEPEVKAVYVMFDPNDFKDQVEIAEDELQDYFESNPTEFEKEKTVEARHILFKVDEGADEKTVEEKRVKAMEIYEKAKSGEDFAELAKTYSEGPTKDRGGFLGAFKKEAMVKPFADKAFSMKAGEISEPVHTRFGWHIIKVEKINEATKTTFEEAAPGIRSRLKEAGAKNLAYDKAVELYDNTFDGENLNRVAAESGYTAETTDFFTRQGPEGIQNRNKFASVAFELPLNEVSDVQDLGNAYYLLQVVEKKDAQVPEFTSVAEKVAADLKKEKQWQQAEADAEACRVKITEGQPMADAGKVYNLLTAQTGDFKRSDAIPDIGYEPDIATAAFQLTVENVLPEKVLKGAKGYYVIQLKERKLPSSEDFEKEKEDIRNRLLQQKEIKTFESWLSALKSKSEIMIEEAVLR